MQQPSAVPGSLEDLTSQWLAHALATDGVGEISVEPLGASVGLLGDLARVRLGQWRSDNLPASVIVKLPTQDPAGRHVGQMLRAWAREVAFYEEVAPASPGTRVPHCFATQVDEAAERWVVVLEDCGTNELDPAAGASETQANAAITALADFHATWWESADTPEWMPAVGSDTFGGLQHAWETNHPAFLDRYRSVLPASTVEWLAEFTPQLPAWAGRAGAEPTTIVHADYRLDNLIFDGDQVTMLDWQTALRGPGAMDVSCFLATALSVDARRTLEPTLIDRYLHRLDDRGVAVDDAWFARSYDENLLWWMGQFANNLAHLEPDDPSVAEGLETMVVRTFTAAADREVGRLL